MKLGLLCFIICVVSSSLWTQTQRYQFDRINQLDGVSIGQVNFIAEDQNGFIWFSEESNSSLTRFDGFSIKRYQHDPKDLNSLGGTYPECVLVDRDGIIWVGFFNSGLDRFDPVTETFTHFDHDPNTENGLSNDVISDIVQGPDGKIYVATFAGLDVLDPATGTFTNYIHDSNDPTSISSNFIRDLFFDSKGFLWVGTGWSNIEYDSGGLNRYDLESHQFTRYMSDPGNPKALQNLFIRAIFEDSKGNFWVGTGGDGLHLMDRATGIFTHFPYDPQNPHRISIPAYDSEPYGVTFIAEDSEGKLWIGGTGVDVYDLEKESYAHFGNNYDYDGTYIENSSWCIYFANNGLIWLSTQPGLYKIDPYKYVIPLIEKRIPVTYLESDSIVWSVSQSGLKRENIFTGGQSTWKYDSNDDNSLSSNRIQCVYKDSKSQIWIGTNRGINKLDHQLGKVTRYKLNPLDSTGIGHNNITSIIEDTNGRLWIGTRNGLYYLNIEKAQFEAFDLPSLFNNYLNSALNVTILHQGGDNEIWIGHEFGGVIFKLNKKNDALYSLDEYIIGNGQYGMLKDQNGVDWLAGQTGLFLYDNAEDKFIKFIDQSTYALALDQEGNIWAETITNVYRISNNGENIIEFDIEIPSEGGSSFIGSSLKGFTLSDGTIIVGAPSRYYSFHPNKIIIPQDSSKLFFTNLWISERSGQGSEVKSIQTSLIEKRAINLSYAQNSFAISFTELDFRSSQKNKILYKLDDYDIEWRETFSENKISYSNIPPGDYQMRIKAPNSISGFWGENSMDIKISPPWWRTWWAYALYGLIFLISIFRFDKWRKERLLEEERARNREVELEHARTLKEAYSELESAHTTLKSTQSQLIQSEKMASLGELTAGIAHEIQNPLNFVNNFSEVSSELLGEMKEALRLAQGDKDNEDMQEAIDIADDVVQNLGKITHHGKRADSIVKGMLQHSRTSSGEKVLTDINALCDEYLRLAYHGLLAKDKSFNAQYEMNFDKNLPQLRVVPQDIGRVLLNLINNAFYAVNEKKQMGHLKGYEPTVTVSTQIMSHFGEPVTSGREGKREELRISVSDNGNGIPKDIVDKIFQPFFTTKATGEGTGLGLSLAYDIVKANGGELKVKSEVGQGTEISFYLPIES